MGQKHLTFYNFRLFQNLKNQISQLALFDVTFLFADEIEKKQTTVRIGHIKVQMTLYNVTFVTDHFNFFSWKTKHINHIVYKRF